MLYSFMLFNNAVNPKMKCGIFLIDSHFSKFLKENESKTYVRPQNYK
jgi:hypothetical protein